MDLQALKAELANDPAGLGYAGKTREQKEALLNDATKRMRARATVRASEIFEAIDLAEYTALTAAKKANVQLVLGLGDQIAINGSNTRAALFDAFPQGSATRANLIAMAQEAVSRADELGLGHVTAGDVERAEAI